MSLPTFVYTAEIRQFDIAQMGVQYTGMDFGKVLVTDRLAREIFSAAARERLLYSRGAEAPPSSLPGMARQRALSLLILFDRLVIHEFGGGGFRLPDLEQEGIVEIIPAIEPPVSVPLATKWEKGRLGSPNRPPRRLLQSLALVQEFRPLVTNRLLLGKDDFVNLVAGKLHISRRKFIDLFLNYAICYAQGDEHAMQKCPFKELFPEDFLREITEELFDFSRGGTSSYRQRTLCC